MNTIPQGITRSRWHRPALAIAGGTLALIIVLVLAGCAQLTQTANQPDIANDNSSGVRMTKALDAKSAVLSGLHGTVEVKTSSGAWSAAMSGQNITAGQSLRTGALSSVDMVFYDGSSSQLGPDSELSVDTLDAVTSSSRIILLTQVQGESEHNVAKSPDPASRYELNTPSGSGSTKGTKFSVLVTPAVLSRFWVEEGLVAVTSENTTVDVAAGQTTVIPVGQPPAEPVFRVTGEGKVMETGDTWNIAGQPFVTDPNTSIVGDPKVGDWVRVSAHQPPENSQFADQITLLRSATGNLFAYSGKVDSIINTAWVISGRTVQVNGSTAIETGLAIGNNVAVVGYLSEGGIIVATHILRIDESSIFEFVGVVQNITARVWTISDIPVTVNDSITIVEGITTGNLVTVKGQIMNDGIWAANSITRAETINDFELTGLVESINPWVVAGTAFDVVDISEIDEGIQIGSRVRVTGMVRADGIWVAMEIEKLDAIPLLHFKFVGQVESLNPWIVSGMALTVNANTVIKDEIVVGEMVKVAGVIQADGTWLATEIKHTGWHLGQLGCLVTSTVVQSISGNQVVLLNGEIIDLSQNILVEGELKVGSVVLLRSCAGMDGVLTPVSLVVLYQLEALPLVATAVPLEGGKVTICHYPPGNPGNRNTISIGQPAVPAHLAHGDTLGPCPSEKSKPPKIKN